MSGGRSTTTPTPPQASTAESSPAQTNGEVTQPATTVTRIDDNTEPPVSAETPPHLLPQQNQSLWRKTNRNRMTR
ncbi:hypothetical protein CgunFtcFv8_000739 [Champsocephalus gunnari]|uniref:Uncharacterized protein n=1 Tax=Champsocephalus gunnari TaxID=52237 RepID=A0AAN8DTB5_CHAGU|nr:hypothetical protein CgunFtcFv8_000739 [Champsocephalus gunnari]